MSNNYMPLIKGGLNVAAVATGQPWAMPLINMLPNEFGGEEEEKYNPRNIPVTASNNSYYKYGGKVRAMNKMRKGGKISPRYMDHITMAYGGMVPSASVELEKNEVVRSPNGEMERFNLPSHANATKANQVSLEQGSEVFSDTLKKGGKTYAEIADKLRKKRESLMKEYIVANIPDKKNRIKMAIKAVDNEISANFDDQNMQAEAEGLPQGQQMAYGGYVGGPDDPPKKNPYPQYGNDWSYNAPDGRSYNWGYSNKHKNWTLTNPNTGFEVNPKEWGAYGFDPDATKTDSPAIPGGGNPMNGIYPNYMKPNQQTPLVPNWSPINPNGPGSRNQYPATGVAGAVASNVLPRVTGSPNDNVPYGPVGGQPQAVNPTQPNDSPNAGVPYGNVGGNPLVPNPQIQAPNYYISNGKGRTPIQVNIERSTKIVDGKEVPLTDEESRQVKASHTGDMFGDDSPMMTGSWKPGDPIMNEPTKDVRSGNEPDPYALPDLNKYEGGLNSREGINNPFANMDKDKLMKFLPYAQFIPRAINAFKPAETPELETARKEKFDKVNNRGEVRDIKESVRSFQDSAQSNYSPVTRAMSLAGTAQGLGAINKSYDSINKINTMGGNQIKGINSQTENRNVAIENAEKLNLAKAESNRRTGIDQLASDIGDTMLKQNFEGALLKNDKVKMGLLIQSIINHPSVLEKVEKELLGTGYYTQEEIDREKKKLEK